MHISEKITWKNAHIKSIMPNDCDQSVYNFEFQMFKKNNITWKSIQGTIDFPRPIFSHFVSVFNPDFMKTTPSALFVVGGEPTGQKCLFWTKDTF